MLPFFSCAAKYVNACLENKICFCVFNDSNTALVFFIAYLLKLASDALRGV